MDDAGVYRLSDDLALVQTVDFFTPIVDDPRDFGEIAASNAISDIYAMGARPITAMNLVAFSVEKLGLDILAEILTGGRNKCEEAGVVLVGGHTVDDPEPKYGLSVTGLVHPDQIITNAGARPGDLLVLTKPIGTGILATAAKAGEIDYGDLAQAIKVMKTLNRDASETMVETGVDACTDVTGFGLLGHLWEMASASGVSVDVYWGAIPLLDNVLEMMDLAPGGSIANARYLQQYLKYEEDLDKYEVILCDAQTSGGLLIAVHEDKISRLLEGLERRGVQYSGVIGSVTQGPPGMIRVTP